MLGDNFICLGESHVGNSIYWESFYPISFEKYWKISLIYVLCIEIMTYANYGNFSIVVFGISLFFTRFIILMTILSTSKFDQSDATSYMIKHLIIHNLSCAHIKQKYLILIQEKSKVRKRRIKRYQKSKLRKRGKG